MGNYIWTGKTWHFSHLTRAMDGVHLIINKPQNSGSSFLIINKFLMTAIHENYKFIINDAGFMRWFWGENFLKVVLLRENKIDNLTTKLAQYMVNKNQCIVFVATQEFSYMQKNVFHLCQRWSWQLWLCSFQLPTLVSKVNIYMWVWEFSSWILSVQSSIWNLCKNTDAVTSHDVCYRV
jgi:hypothetical protein